MATPLSSRVVAGIGWSAAATVPSMAAALAAQVALGLLLGKEDFGVYGIALGISSFALVIRDGGVRLYLIQLHPEEVRAGAAAALRLAYAWSFGLGLALAAAAFPLAAAYSEPGMAPVMLVLAASMPLSAYPAVALALVQVEMRFRDLAVVSLVSALLRYGGAVGFAVMGLGALSMAIPFVVVGAFELAAGRFYSRFPLTLVLRRSEGDGRHRWFRATRWSMAGSLAMQLGLQADYVALGLVASTGVVGVYFFGYQLAIQLGLLTTQVISRVLIPALAQIRDDRPRAERVFRQAVATTLAVLGPLAAWLAVSAGDLEALLWHGRWSEAVVPIRVVAATIPFQVVLSMGDWLLQAWGNFALWTALTLTRGAGLFCAALVAGLLFPTDAARIALCIGAYLVLSSTILFAAEARAVGFPMRDLLGGAVIPFVGTAVAALGAAAVLMANLATSPLLSLLATSAASILPAATFYLLCWRQGRLSVGAFTRGAPRK